jgi:SAM-dependent methyltransferase
VSAGSGAHPTKWGERAAARYDEAYARRYREHDEAAQDGASIVRFSDWITGICDRFSGPIDVLDIGCGTGRYFHALRHVRRLTGIDVSRPMLDAASQPVGGMAGVESLSLVEGDFLARDFGPAEFDLAYSIGVLAEHSPFDVEVASRVRRWLRPGARFAFTAVHPQSHSVPRTLKRRLGEWLLPAAIGPLRESMRARMMSGGLYADEPYLRDVLGASGFTVESIEPFESDVHLHLLTVARNAE